MSIRQEIEDRESRFLTKTAALSSKTRGRRHSEKESDFRTAYQRDRDRIIHCKAFRRLKHKTQVFISPVEDHYRTRLTHTLEVSQIARTIARALQLNEDLTEAIALGHDLGHTPFGHAGEHVLDDILQKYYNTRFYHNYQSARVVEAVENEGRGLNLTWEVIDGIRNHTPDDPKPATLEGQIVRLADRMAYLRHDIDDAIRAGVLSARELPKRRIKVLGKNILDIMVKDIIVNSREKDAIAMSKEVLSAMNGLYDFMYKRVYTNPAAKGEERKIPELLTQLFRYYHYNPEFQKKIKENEQLSRTIDFIAGMTDRYAINKFAELFVPDEWRKAA